MSPESSPGLTEIMHQLQRHIGAESAPASEQTAGENSELSPYPIRVFGAPEEVVTPANPIENAKKLFVINPEHAQTTGLIIAAGLNQPALVELLP